MFDNIDLKWFVISFSFGILLVYISTPPKQIVHKFPSPDNVNIIYTSKNNECYKYEHEEVDCETSTNVQNQPVIDNFKI